MSAAHSVEAEIEPGGHAHPSVGIYIRIAVVLGVLTALEVAAYTQEWLGELMVPVLLGLAAAKFVLVVSFYMHLRFDNRLFTAVFGFGLLVAGSIVTALIFLFHQYPLPPAPLQ